MKNIEEKTMSILSQNKLGKAIMNRLKLRNDYLEDRNDAFQSVYRKQSNLCAALLWKVKKSISRI